MVSFGVGTSVPYPCIQVDIRVLLLVPCLAKEYIIVSSISNNKVNCMASLCSSAIAQPYQLLYDYSSTQQFTIDGSDKQRHIFPILLSFSLNYLQAKLIRNGLGDEVLHGA
jgi:hypothetical protein